MELMRPVKLSKETRRTPRICLRLISSWQLKVGCKSPEFECVMADQSGNPIYLEECDQDLGVFGMSKTCTCIKICTDLCTHLQKDTWIPYVREDS